MREVRLEIDPLDIYGLTVRGKGRRRNEDAILCPAATLTTTDGLPCSLVAIADGVGGGPCGERASNTAIATLKAEFCAAPVSSYQAGPLLTRWFAAANGAVLEIGAEENCLGLATTLVAALLVDDEFCIASLGDSRAYLVRGGSAKQLTQDHGLAGISGAGLAKALGSSSAESPDIIGPFELRDGDVIALTSDGLHGPLGDEDIAAVIDGSPAAESGKRLLDLALSRGSLDDASIVLIRSSIDSRGTP